MRFTVWDTLQIELEFRNVFEEKEKPEYPQKNLSEQGREPTIYIREIIKKKTGIKASPLLQDPVLFLELVLTNAITGFF